MELPVLVGACDLFVYLNVQFRGFQFEEEELEEVPSTCVANNSSSSELRHMLVRTRCQLNGSLQRQNSN